MLLGKSEVGRFFFLEHASQVLIVIIHDQKYVLKIILVLWNDHVIEMGRENVLFHLTQILHDLNFTDHFFELIG